MSPTAGVLNSFLNLPVGYFVREVKEGHLGTKTIYCKPVETLKEEIDFFGREVKENHNFLGEKL